MLQRAEVERIVREILVDVLMVDESDVVPAARFFPDLNGESIDLLDAGFQIEKRLGVRVEFTKAFAGDDAMTDSSGIVTDNWLASRRLQYPFLDFDRLPASPTPETLSAELLTVNAIVEFTLRAPRIGDGVIAPAIA